jgi:hypothetical protein
MTFVIAFNSIQDRMVVLKGDQRQRTYHQCFCLFRRDVSKKEEYGYDQHEEEPSCDRVFWTLNGLTSNDE